MVLYLLASLPIVFSLVVLLPWDARRVPQTISLVSTFTRGALIFLPAFLVMLIARRIFGFSFNGFFLYLSLLLRDHLVPLLLGTGGFLLVQQKLDFPGTEEGVFLAVFSFLAGFLSLANIADLVAGWGRWDAHVLFLLPSLRIVAALFVALSAQRFFRWEGRDGLSFCGISALVAGLAALSSFVFRINRAGLSALLAAGAAAGALVLIALRFPRVLKG